MLALTTSCYIIPLRIDPTTNGSQRDCCSFWKIWTFTRDHRIIILVHSTEKLTTSGLDPHVWQWRILLQKHCIYLFMSFKGLHLYFMFFMCMLNVVSNMKWSYSTFKILAECRLDNTLVSFIPLFIYEGKGINQEQRQTFSHQNLQQNYHLAEHFYWSWRILR